MEKAEFFALSFEEKLQFICSIRSCFSQATAYKEKEEVIPRWLIEKAENLDDRFGDMGALFPDFALFEIGQEDNVEAICLMDEIINDLLYLLILELEESRGIPWAGFPQEEYD